MSGYLAAIAARVGGGRPVVQPRPLARFEVEAPAGDAALELTAVESPRATTQRDAAVVPLSPEPARPARPVTHGQPARQAKGAMIAERPDAPRAMPAPRTEAAPAPLRPADRVLPANASATAPPPAVPRLQERQPVSLPSESTRREATAPSHPATALPLEAEPSGKPEQSDPPAPPTSRDLSPPVRLRLATRQRPVAPPSASNAAPITQAPVSVTIGRVEIRATMRRPQPPAPVRPAAPPPGELSLDAYLRRRDGGGR